MNLGLQSIVLVIAIVQGVVFSILLLAKRVNRGANRLLATLLILFVLTLVPSTIGFAGAYDRFPWLTFAPFTVTFGLGATLWLYVRRLLTGTLPRNWGVHALPLLVQIGYYTILFLQPLEWRYEFNREFHASKVVPVETFLALSLTLAYAFAILRLYRKYRAWVPHRVSDSENFRLDWVRNFLLAAAGGLLIWIAFEVVNETVRPLSYANFFWLDLVAATLLYSFAIAGYRHSELEWPTLDASSRDLAENTNPDMAIARASQGSVAASANGADWESMAEQVAQRVEMERWYLEPDLTIDTLARRLATNNWALSRTINEGLQCNFNDFINKFRVDAVKACLANPGESRGLLDIALEHGFNSKTSFNRSFKKLTGETPRSCRERLQKGAKS